MGVLINTWHFAVWFLCLLLFNDSNPFPTTPRSHLAKEVVGTLLSIIDIVTQERV